MGKMNDYEASSIAKETYKRNKSEIVIVHEITNEIVISFEGNQTNDVVTERGGNDLFE